MAYRDQESRGEGSIHLCHADFTALSWFTRPTRWQLHHSKEEWRLWTWRNLAVGSLIVVYSRPEILPINSQLEAKTAINFSFNQPRPPASSPATSLVSPFACKAPAPPPTPLKLQFPVDGLWVAVFAVEKNSRTLRRERLRIETYEKLFEVWSVYQLWPLEPANAKWQRGKAHLELGNVCKNMPSASKKALSSPLWPP